MKPKHRRSNPLDNLDLDLDDIEELKTADLSGIVNTMRRAIIDEDQ
ncbi:MAG: hypothetical protein J7K40_13875 [candidate division Zixibacteria bacterium]|nr:hypothetical protein [candidate division Zixibacteria bacterium]